MPDVYAWPPVQLVGHEYTISRPVSRAEGISGRPYFSQSKATRSIVTAEVAGIGSDLAGAAYVEQLKRFLDGKPPFVRVVPLPHVYWRAVKNLQLRRGQGPVNWSATGVPLDWTSGGVALNWVIGAPVACVAGADVWPFLDCTGLPPSQPVAYPGELVMAGGQTARVIRLVRSDASGAARVYLDQALSSDTVLIGVRESIAMEILEFPRAVQPVSGRYSYQFDMQEVFEDEFDDGFNEVNPWN